MVEVDPRLSPRRHLEVMCHEGLHLALPDLQGDAGEKEIDRIGKAVSSLLWDANYRRVHLPKHTTPVRITRNKKQK